MKLKQNFDNQISIKGLTESTRKTYWSAIVRYLKFHKQGDSWVHPSTLGTKDVERYLTDRAVNQHVSATTQNGDLQAILFMYRNCLGIELQGINAIRAKKPKRLPVVLNRQEVRLLLDQLTGNHWLIASLMYGCGLRISEALSVRIKDFDFERGQLMVRSGKGRKDRFTCLPASLFNPIRKQIQRVEEINLEDIRRKRKGISLPFAYGRKSPSSHLDLNWYFLFPSKGLSCPPRQPGILLRHHIHKTSVGRAISLACKDARIRKRVTPHTLRHTFATHLIESGVHIQQVSELLGHASIETTSLYLHCDSRNINERVSPLDRLSLVA